MLEHKSLCNKIDELKATVSSNSPDVITVTEICPTNVRYVNIIVTAIQIHGYDLFTNNMKKRGIARPYVIKDLHANMEEGLDDELVEENLWVSVELCGRDKLLIGCIYRSPNSTDENNDIHTHKQHVRSSLISLSLDTSMLKRYAGRHGAPHLRTRWDRSCWNASEMQA